MLEPNPPYEILPLEFCKFNIIFLVSGPSKPQRPNLELPCRFFFNPIRHLEFCKFNLKFRIRNLKNPHLVV